MRAVVAAPLVLFFLLRGILALLAALDGFDESGARDARGEGEHADADDGEGASESMEVSRMHP